MDRHKLIGEIVRLFGELDSKDQIIVRAMVIQRAHQPKRKRAPRRECRVARLQ